MHPCRAGNGNALVLSRFQPFSLCCFTSVFFCCFPRPLVLSLLFPSPLSGLWSRFLLPSLLGVLEQVERSWNAAKTRGQSRLHFPEHHAYFHLKTMASHWPTRVQAHGVGGERASDREMQVITRMLQWALVFVLIDYTDNVIIVNSEKEKWKENTQNSTWLINQLFFFFHIPLCFSSYMHILLLDWNYICFVFYF